MAITGASAAEAASAARPTGRAIPSRSLAVARVVAVPKADRTQVPTLIGEVTFATRSMLRNRSGRPRSTTRRTPLTAVAADAETRQRRARRWSPVSRAPAASRADPPASPPVKK